MKLLIRYSLFLILLFFFCTCSDREEATTLFELKDNATNIQFSNDLSYTEDFNPYVYRNFYNGGGVALGDINNDGLDDIYFTGNLVDNKLFLNKGNWKFENITVKAGVGCSNVWSTGATFIDINADGHLDLYVCKSGKPGGQNRNNELFINNGDLTFTEQSKKYGLDINALSVQAGFFDYDKDGDLDCYLLSNSIKSVGGFDLIKDQRNIPDPNGQGNKLLRNDDGKFNDVTLESGIYSSNIGFGLGVTFGDFNNDNWPDIYVSNDFFERDYLYINDTKGGFNEDLESYFSSISMGAMGADFADLDNDLFPDIIVTEMLPKAEERKKTKTVFETWDKQQVAKKRGYFNQFSRNTLQRNLGNKDFIDLSRQTNVAATEWSWSALLFDADNDGLRDIFISNGIYKDLLDRDYLTYSANDEVIRNRIQKNEKDVIKNLIDAMPSKPMENTFFHNLGGFNFEETSQAWGVNQPSFSNGSVYGDLDNDGDLDLVINNVNMPSFVYENKIDTLTNRSIQFKLRQEGQNPNAVGSKIAISYDNGKRAMFENYNAKGFQSSTSTIAHFGVGKVEKIDSVFITWPDGKTSLLTNLQTNKNHLIRKENTLVSNQEHPKKNTPKKPFKKKSPLFEFKHKENSFIDFNKERLLIQMFSNEGPAYAQADVNNDKKPDFYVGGAKYQTGNLFLSTEDGYKSNTAPFESQSNSEDTDAIFFDADNDGDLDLYVCHGGKAYSNYSQELHDTFYLNDEGILKKSLLQPKFPIPVSSSSVSASDYDNDGDVDLFVSERFKVNTYGLPASGFLLENDGTGKFEVNAPIVFQNIGMITDAEWADINNDGWDDLIVVGEWMPVKIYINDKGKFKDKSAGYGFENTSGLWSSLKTMDLDNDGDKDIIVGNLGTNTFFEPEMGMFVSDFDSNGFQEQIICKKVKDAYYPIVDKDEFISQMPFLKKKLVYYKDYATADMVKIFGSEKTNNSLKVEISTLESHIFLNNGNNFIPQVLPPEIQASPVYAIETSDLDKDGTIELLIGGNQFLVKPQFGSYDGSRAWVIFDPLNLNSPSRTISLGIKGQIRALDYLKDGTLVVIKNNEEVDFYKKNY